MTRSLSPKAHSPEYAFGYSSICWPRYVPVPGHRDYGDVSPVSGAILGGGKHTVQVAVDVLPIDTREG